MKKFMLSFISIVFILSGSSLFAQEYYLGGAKPEGAQPSQGVIPQNVQLALDPDAIFTGAVQPENYAPPQRSAGGGSRDFPGCPPCGIPEGEGDIPDEGDDNYNGGCNSIPPVFLSIQIGDVYCGRGNGYTVGGLDYRDTDWYEITLTETKTLHWTGIANFYMQLTIASGPCASLSAVASDYPLPDQVGTCSWTCDPGTWYFFVAPAGFGDALELDGDYVVTLTEEDPGEPDTWCPFELVCAFCGIPEGEPPHVDDIGDLTNYGCNGDEFTPARPELFSPIAVGDVICGSGDHYVYNTLDFRDTDWYKLIVTSGQTLYWSGIADFSVTLWIVEGPCASMLVLDWITLNPGEYGTISAYLDPGEYYFVIAPSDWDMDNNGDYMVALTDMYPGNPARWCPLTTPVSNWALYIGIGLILIVTLARFRRLI